jgi:proteasome regulatory subunit
MLDPAILRPGRFDRLIEVPTPGTDGRERILEIHTSDMNLAADVDFVDLAEELAGYSGADVASLTTEAGMFAIRDDRTEVRREDFDAAREKLDGGGDDVVDLAYQY